LIQNSFENSTSSTGNFNKALQLLQPDSESFFEKWFVDWLEQHLGQGNAAMIQIDWSEQNSGLRKRNKRNFYILYRNVSPSALLNYQTPTVYMEPQVEKFELGNLLHL
jgi:DNA polymerase-3 subunit delta'